MALSGKRPIGNADRLGDLPDGLIHNIMSFLTAREAVQTCVLSRRWKDLWCSMPCLNIDERQFRIIGSVYNEIWDDEMSEDEYEIDCLSLEHFVINLLMFHSAPRLDRFRFHVISHHDIKFVNSWIRRGIKRCPKVVQIHSTDGVRLPHLSGSSSSSRLTRLHLTGITLDKTFTRQLRSSCPVLDDLELRRCRLADHTTKIASLTLKNLTIEDCTTNSPSTLTITAPTLTYLQLVITGLHHNWQAVVVSDMACIVKATICLKDSAAMLPCKLLSSLMFAKELELTGLRTLANLHIGSDTFPVFHCVRTLLLDRCDLSDNCDIMGSFMNNAPCLQKLTLQQCELPEGSKKSKAGGNVERTSLQCKETPSFQCSRLKMTEIKYRDDNDVQKLFDLLLGVWRNLQKSTIVIKKASRSYSMM